MTPPRRSAGARVLSGAQPDKLSPRRTRPVPQPDPSLEANAVKPQAWRLLAVLTFAALGLSAARADDWPQWMGPNRDGVWREQGLLAKFPEGGPKVLWRAKIDGGYAGPAVAGGRVFVTDYVTRGDRTPNAAKLSALEGTERVLCLDAASGKELWKHEYPCTYKISYPAGPRCTPTVSGGKVYTLGAMGDLRCLDAASGKLLWAKDLKKEYNTAAPFWGFAGHPLVDGKRLICLAGGKGSVAVAFDKDTGKELWRALSASGTGYSPPTLIEAGGKKQLVIWHAEAINGLDPESGKVYWSVPLKAAYGMSIMAPRQWKDYLFAGGIGFHAVLLKLAADKPAAEVVWRGKNKTAVYPVNSTPFLEGGYIYGVDQPGQLRCVELKTGKRIWETTAPTTGERPASSGTAFLVKNGDRFVLMSETGHLILARLTPRGYEEVSRAKILEPTGDAFGRPVVWSHPAFANRCVFARNDREIVCVSLAADQGGK
jgi:outer membrane protein assembly factor BamB